MASNSVIAAVDWEGPRGPHHAEHFGDFTEVRLSEIAEFWGHLGVCAVVEMRSHGNPPGTFVGVRVMVGSVVVMEWSGVAPSPGSVGDRIRPMLDRSSTHGRVSGPVSVRWPDVTPRRDIPGDTVEGRRRSAAWLEGERHRRARLEAAGEDMAGPWDESDWAAAATRYGLLARHMYGGPKNAQGDCALCGHAGDDCTGIRRMELRYVGTDPYWQRKYPYFAAVEWELGEGRGGSRGVIDRPYKGIVIRYDAPGNNLDGGAYKAKRRGWKRSGVGVADAMGEVSRVLAEHLSHGGTARVEDFRWERAR